MKKCPVHNCPAKTGCKAAVLVASILGAIAAASVVLLGVLWSKRKEHPVSTGLVLGGGLSNLLERLRQGKVYDYVQFPKAPGRWSRYVYNLADFAIMLGGVGLALKKKKR